MSIRSKLHHFQQLNKQEVITVFQALYWLLAIRLGLAVMGFTKVLTGLEQSTNLLSENLDSRQKAERVAALLNMAARNLPIGINCLPRSLALKKLLQQRGIRSDLRFGVRRHDGQFEAHAWVECLGAPLIDGPSIREEFLPFEHSINPSGLIWK